MHWPFALLLLFLVGCVMSIVILDDVGTSRLEGGGQTEALQPQRAPLLPAPARS